MRLLFIVKRRAFSFIEACVLEDGRIGKYLQAKIKVVCMDHWSGSFNSTRGQDKILWKAHKEKGKLNYFVLRYLLYDDNHYIFTNHPLKKKTIICGYWVCTQLLKYCFPPSTLNTAYSFIFSFINLFPGLLQYIFSSFCQMVNSIVFFYHI